jgi:hypothetical protein
MPDTRSKAQGDRWDVLQRAMEANAQVLATVPLRSAGGPLSWGSQSQAVSFCSTTTSEKCRRQEQERQNITSASRRMAQVSNPC